MAESDFDKDMTRMQDQLARLKHEYDLFFAGNRRDAPKAEHRVLEKLVVHYRNASLPRLVQQFRFSTFLSAYTTQVEMWNKWMRAKEEGLSSDPRLVAAVRKERAVLKELEKGKVAPEPAPPPSSKAAQPASSHAAERRGPLRGLYEEFITAKLQAGEAPDLDFAAFEKKLAQQREAIQKKYADHDISFGVTVKDGKASLKAKVTKRKEHPVTEFDPT